MLHSLECFLFILLSYKYNVFILFNFSVKEEFVASKENIITRLETDTDKVLVFPKGIPGFEKYTRYVVYHKEENGLSAFWLESCE
ncbi:MAG: hypothetical protein CR992_00450, partial [Desulfobacterales bacterium]